MHDFPLVTTIAAGFTAAWILGLLTQWLRLSPIVGYLLAGVLIGPHTPGFVGDIHLAHQLAEIGVILLMFGVGLHFHLKDLLAVRSVAIPGAVGQSLAATLISMVAFQLFGVDLTAGAIVGMAMAVASTVVLMRVLMDADKLHSPAGHVAVGWLLVEDVFTVVVLVLIPVLGNQVTPAETGGFFSHPLVLISVALLKLATLVAVILVLGARVIPWALTQVARLRSRELFTLTVLVFSVAIASGAYVLFGASMALGAFLAGMVVAQSPVSHQAAADALPLRDAFAVLFFVSVGMLFDPSFLWNEPLIMLAALTIILLVKPLVALAIVAALGQSARTALTVAIGLAQIGEFSFILSDSARKYGLMPESGHNLLVGGAILSITLYPLLFRSIPRIERWLQRYPRLWHFLNARSERKIVDANSASAESIAEHVKAGKRLAVVVGYGPVGRTVDRLLREAGLDSVVIDMNTDTVLELERSGRRAIFGDASRDSILELAGVGRASHLVLALPQTINRSTIVSMARNLNPALKIFVRAHYLRERGELEHVGATAAIFEEAEAAVALARLVLVDSGAGRESIDRAVRDIRTRLILDNVSSLNSQAIRNIMIPWTRVRRLTDSMSTGEVRRKLRERQFSRWPVVDAHGTPKGYLLAKDLIGLGPDEPDWTSLIRPLLDIGMDDNVGLTLELFQRESATIAVVKHQGNPVGIVTIEDILEQVVGRMEDEYPRHQQIQLEKVLVTDHSLLDLASTSWEDAIEEVARHAPAESLPPGVDIGYLAIERERELSTDVGFGVAIPHARCPNLTRPFVVFARSSQGLVFGRQSSDLVRLIFLLVTPANQPEVQVVLLSQIARLAADPERRQRLLEASTTSEVIEVVAGIDNEALERVTKA
jgi:CPA2 family monovalent cation:H+ antiporter-2